VGDAKGCGHEVETVARERVASGGKRKSNSGAEEYSRTECGVVVFELC
jgi:hypothetical protein